MEWNKIVARLTPYIVKVETQDGHGTGFMCLYNPNNTFVGIATARHVVEQADNWEQPVKLSHFHTNKNAFLQSGDRVIFPDVSTDSAVILVPVGKLDLPEEPIDLLPIAHTLEVGTEVGWLGYPGIARDTLCFFSGIVSAWQDWRHSYLIDGVAAPGVSGGPVAWLHPTEGLKIIGLISSYVSAKTTPGLAIARDVSHFHSIIGWMNNLEEARKEKEKQQQEQQTKIEAASAQPEKPESAPPQDRQPT
jgi:hypothetical protein